MFFRGWLVGGVLLVGGWLVVVGGGGGWLVGGVLLVGGLVGGVCVFVVWCYVCKLNRFFETAKERCKGF